jgi:hypothetical protein
MPGRPVVGAVIDWAPAAGGRTKPGRSGSTQVLMCSRCSAFVAMIQACLARVGAVLRRVLRC